MEKEKFDVAIIGSGPGGYVAAIRAAGRGLKTALIEAKKLGGVCLNCGCIPSKALIANAELFRKIKEAKRFGIYPGDVNFNYAEMNQRKDQVVDRMRRGVEGLIASNRISHFKGYGKFLSSNEIKILGETETIIESENIIIASGSEPRALSHLPFDYERIHDSTSFLDIKELPKRLVIIGGGVIGCEFACLHNAFGVEVTILELLPSILTTEGTQIASTLTASFKKQGIKVETAVTVTKIEKTPNELLIHLEDGRKLTADSVLISVGRKLNSENLGLEKVGVTVEKNGAIGTNEKMQTNISHIYAIGDVTGKSLLAHVASHQGIVAVDNIARVPSKMHYNAIPSVVFTYPEVGSIGYTQEQALKEGIEVRVGKFPFLALGKSQAIMETEGFAQIVANKKTGAIIGAQVVGYGAATLIAEMALAITNELTLDSITETIHAHPTTAEAWMEAAFLAEEMPLHLPPRAKT